WLYRKAPEIVIEVVSNEDGGELDRKRRDYATIEIPYYVVYDPEGLLSSKVLTSFAHPKRGYEEMEDHWYQLLQLGLPTWVADIVAGSGTWLRGCDDKGALLPLGHERAETAEERAEGQRKRAERQRKRADREKKRADEAEQRLADLAARLREMGIDPDA